MADVTMPGMDVIRKQLEAGDGDLLRELVSGVVHALMSAEADAFCGAEYGERSPDRVNSRNGYRERRWDTRVGTIPLLIPKLREGSYYPHLLLEPRTRSERALVSVVADLYLAGVCTRRVDKVVRQLGIQGISKSQVSRLASEMDELVEGFRTRPWTPAYPYLMLDALVVTGREGGRICNTCVCHATAVNARACARASAWTSSPARMARPGWASCVAWSPAALSGVQLVTSDSHPGLVDAIRSTLPGASWQRCRTHFMRNLLTRVPKQAQPAGDTGAINLRPARPRSGGRTDRGSSPNSRSAFPPPPRCSTRPNRTCSASPPTQSRVAPIRSTNPLNGSTGRSAAAPRGLHLP